MLEELEEWFKQIVIEHGYFGAFLVSILGNLIPFIPIPYLVAIFYMAAYFPVNPVLLGFISGVGGTVGKAIVYILSFGSGKLIGEESEYRIARLRQLLDKYGALAVFIFTITPSPDDVVIIPLGLIRYSFFKFLVSCLLGKVALSIFIAVFGKMFVDLMSIWLGGSIYGTIASIIFLIITTAALLKIDWMIVTDIVDQEGWRGIIRRLRNGRWREFLVKNKTEKAKR